MKVSSRVAVLCLACGLVTAPAHAEGLLGTAFIADDAFLLAQESMDDLFESPEPAAEKPTPAAPVAPPAAPTPAPAAVTRTPPADTTQSEPGSMDDLFEAAPATAAEPRTRCQASNAGNRARAAGNGAACGRGDEATAGRQSHRLRSK